MQSQLICFSNRITASAYSRKHTAARSLTAVRALAQTYVSHIFNVDVTVPAVYERPGGMQNVETTGKEPHTCNGFNCGYVKRVRIAIATWLYLKKAKAMPMHSWHVPLTFWLLWLTERWRSPGFLHGSWRGFQGWSGFCQKKNCQVNAGINTLSYAPRRTLSSLRNKLSLRKSTDVKSFTWVFEIRPWCLTQIETRHTAQCQLQRTIYRNHNYNWGGRKHRRLSAWQ